MPKHLTIEPTSIAKQFAEALDLDDFATAESLLASECVYEARAGEIIGTTPSSVLTGRRAPGQRTISTRFNTRVASRMRTSRAPQSYSSTTSRTKTDAIPTNASNCSASEPMEKSCASNTLNCRANGRRSMRSSPQ